MILPVSLRPENIHGIIDHTAVPAKIDFISLFFYIGQEVIGDSAVEIPFVPPGGTGKVAARFIVFPFICLVDISYSMNQPVISLRVRENKTVKWSDPRAGSDKEKFFSLLWFYIGKE